MNTKRKMQETILMATVAASLSISLLLSIACQERPKEDPAAANARKDLTPNGDPSPLAEKGLPGPGRRDAPTDASGNGSEQAPAGQGVAQPALEKAACDNPISMTVAGAEGIDTREDLPQRKFKLTKMQVYRIDESTNNSFLISMSPEAADKDTFAAKVQCDGWKVAGSKAEVNLDGTLEILFKRNFDLAEKEKVTGNSQLHIHFKAGKLSDVKVDINKETSEAPNASDEEKLTIDKLQLKNGWVISKRVLLSADKKQLHVILKQEQKISGSEKVLMMMTQASYEIENN